MLEYYFSKGFVVLERNSNNLKITDNEAKQIIHAMDMHDSDYVMTCTTELPSIKTPLRCCCYRHIFINIILKPYIMVNRKY